MIATTFGAGQVLFSFLWFFLFVIEIWLMLTVFIDIFRSDDLKGWQKAFWILPVLVFPLLGVLLYLVVRGDKLRAHQIQTIEEREEALSRYVLHLVGRQSSAAEELHKLAELRDRGELTAEEYRRLKERVLSEDGPLAA